MSLSQNLKVGKQLAELLGADTQVLTKKGGDFLKNVMGGYWDKFAEGPRRAVFNELTEKAPAVNIDAFLNRNLLKGGLERYKSTGKVRNIHKPGFHVKEGDVLVPHVAPGVMRQGPPKAEGTPNPTGFQPAAGRELVDTLKRPGTYPDWMEFGVQHPEFTSKLAGTAVASGIPLTAGAFLTAYADSGKPRSDYAYPVEPTRGSYDETGGVAASSNEYNPSVESARAAAQYRHDLEEQKQRHKIELMRMRGESRTPGVQGSSAPSGGGADLGSYLGSIYGNRNTNYF